MQNLRSIACALALIALASLGAACSARPDRPAPATAPPRALADGARSLDDLVDGFLLALEKNDLAALNALRLSRSEYLDVIVPGTVQEGQQPRQVSEKPKEYFWQVMDFKSREIAKSLVARFGGRHYRSHAYEFTSPPRRYAWYSAHGRLSMLLEADDQTVYRLRGGWIAEVGGRYKFIGFEAED